MAMVILGCYDSEKKRGYVCIACSKKDPFNCADILKRALSKWDSKCGGSLSYAMGSVPINEVDNALREISELSNKELKTLGFKCICSKKEYIQKIEQVLHEKYK